MSDNEKSDSIIIRPAWLNSVNPDDLKVSQQFESHSYQVSLDDSIADSTCCLKRFDGAAPSPEHLLLFDSLHGPFALDNGRELFQSLLGIPFGDMDLSTFSKTLGVYLAALPAPFAKVFGWISPNFFSSVEAASYCATLQLRTKDCTITNTIMATSSFWSAILASDQLVKIADKRSHTTTSNAVCLPLVLGRTTIKKQELSDLLPGDIFCLDKSLFQANNEGVINLGSKRIFVEWVSRGEVDVLKVVDQGARLCK